MTKLLVNEFPKIAAEYSSSNDVPLELVAASSGRKFRWRCSVEGHEWDGMSVAQRTYQGQNCPYCSNRRLLKGFNDLRTRYPELIRERWDFERNQVDPGETYGRASERFFWTCDKGHSYKRTVQAEATRKCGICTGHVVQPGVNDAETFATQQILSSWSPSNKNPLSHYSRSSPYNGLWVCKLGHEYRAPVGRRLAGGGTCPFCLNRRLLTGFNDLATRYPDLASEFDSTLNKKQAQNVLVGSAKKYWWRCRRNAAHSWETSIALRISQGTGCPRCRVSNLEVEVADWVKIQGVATVRNDRDVLSGLELDIVLPELKIAIEVNGTFWHSDRWVMKTRGMSAKALHERKKDLAAKAGFLLVFVWEDDWRTRLSLTQKSLSKVLAGGEPDSTLTTLSKG